MKHSFHVRFTKSTFVSHFTPIPMKRETKGHFRPPLTYDRSWKKDETSLSKNSAPRFTLTSFVSRHFMFRFTIPLVATNTARTNSAQALFVCSRYCFGASEAASFWKRGPFRSGWNIGSSQSEEGVSSRAASGHPTFGGITTPKFRKKYSVFRN